MDIVSDHILPVTRQPSDAVLNVTSIGDHFGIPSTRMNLVLSELGWITKDGKDWRIAEAGKALGGVQCQHDRSGKLYVRWPAAILGNGILLASIQESRSEITSSHAPKADTSTVDSQQFRGKFPGTYWAMDGHYVRSKAEAIIDNWLYYYRICHAYERRLPVEENLYCDFFINGPRGVYIEYWGSQSDPRYLAHRQKKIETYNKHGFQLIELTDSEISTIDDVLPVRLRRFGIETEYA